MRAVSLRIDHVVILVIESMEDRKRQLVPSGNAAKSYFLVTSTRL